MHGVFFLHTDSIGGSVFLVSLVRVLQSNWAIPDSVGGNTIVRHEIHAQGVTPRRDEEAHRNDKGEGRAVVPVRRGAEKRRNSGTAADAACGELSVLSASRKAKLKGE